MNASSDAYLSTRMYASGKPCIRGTRMRGLSDSRLDGRRRDPGAHPGRISAIDARRSLGCLRYGAEMSHGRFVDLPAQTSRHTAAVPRRHIDLELATRQAGRGPFCATSSKATRPLRDSARYAWAGASNMSTIASPIPVDQSGNGEARWG